MGHGATVGGYKDLVLFLATAGIIVPLFQRLKISPVLGFLGAGVFLGPYGLGRWSAAAPWLSAITVTRPEEIGQLGEFGVVFLLFMIGLGLSWERLRLMRREVFGLGSLQLVASAAAIGLVARLAGQPDVAALTLGVALALSSTAIVMPVLAEQKRMHTRAGRGAFAILLFQDLAVAPIMVALGLANGMKAGVSLRLIEAFAPAALGLVVLVATGRLLLRPMMKSVARAKSQELFMAACLLVVIGAGLFSALAGLSMALGAFVAGMLLAETEYRHEVEVTIEPFKGLLLGLFFLTVGIGLDLGRLAAQPVLIFGLAIGLIALKTGVTFAAGRLTGMPARAAIETALPLAAGGEFAFVVVGAAMAAGLIARPIGDTAMVAATLSMFAIPALGGFGARLGKGAGRLAPEPEPVAAENGPPRVLIVGYGRVGRLVAEMLSRHEIDWAAVDRDARAAAAAHGAGEPVFFGDAARTDFLRRMGLDAALALVVTMDSPEGAEAVTAAARALRPDLIIVARARDTRHAQRLYELGATNCVPETIEASLQLSEAVLVDIGRPMGLVIASIHERRDEFRKLLTRPETPGGRRARARRQV